MPEPKSIDELLALEPQGENRFEVALGGFGGHTMGCAARAAALSCPGRAMHAFHCSFLRPVPTDRAVSLHVDTVRDGRRLSQRLVRILDRDRLLFEARASFTVPTEGIEYQGASCPEVPAPEELASEQEIARLDGWTDWEPGPLEIKRIGPQPNEPGQDATGPDAWIGPRHPIPDDPCLHTGALLYGTDVFSHFGVVRRMASDLRPEHFASLDHAVWIHRSVAWEDWWLFVTTSEIASGGRALSRREVYTRDGTLVATVAQEALVSPPAG